MKPVDVLILAVIAGIFLAAFWCIYRAKKQGKKCIGCPDSCRCPGGCSHCDQET